MRSSKKDSIPLEVRVYELRRGRQPGAESAQIFCRDGTGREYPRRSHRFGNLVTLATFKNLSLDRETETAGCVGEGFGK